MSYASHYRPISPLARLLPSRRILYRLASASRSIDFLSRLILYASRLNSFALLYLTLIFSPTINFVICGYHAIYYLYIFLLMMISLSINFCYCIASGISTFARTRQCFSCLSLQQRYLNASLWFRRAEVWYAFFNDDRLYTMLYILSNSLRFSWFETLRFLIYFLVDAEVW